MIGYDYDYDNKQQTTNNEQQQKPCARYEWHPKRRGRGRTGLLNGRGRPRSSGRGRRRNELQSDSVVDLEWLTPDLLTFSEATYECVSERREGSDGWRRRKLRKMNGGGLPRPSCIGAYPQLQQ